MISVELNTQQVNQVVRQATGNNGLAGLLGSLNATITIGGPHYSQSLWRGLLVLAVFADGKARGVKETAGALDGSMSTTHRYLRTLVAVGLLDQDAKTRRYKLAGR